MLYIHVQENILELLNGEYLYFEHVNFSGDNVKVCEVVKSIDNQTKVAQVSKYLLILQKDSN